MSRYQSAPCLTTLLTGDGLFQWRPVAAKTGNDTRVLGAEGSEKWSRHLVCCQTFRFEAAALTGVVLSATTHWLMIGNFSGDIYFIDFPAASLPC